MIFVRFLSEASGNLVGFVMEGHAGYADPGEDIVCAAVSSVAYMTANTITEINMLFSKGCRETRHPFSYPQNEA